MRLQSIIVLLCALASAPAFAHSIGVSRGEYRALGTSVDARLTFARPELALAIAGLDSDGDRTVSAAELQAHRDSLATSMVAGLEVASSAGSCSGTLLDAALTEQDGVLVRLVYRCPVADSTYSLRLPLLFALSSGHRHLAALESGTGVSNQVVFENQPQFRLPATAQPGNATAFAWQLFSLGIEHILSGYDHLCFLLGLILVGGRLRSMLLVITAFTVAHSITLALAALGIVAPSPALVEPAIALSIAYVGIENWFVGDTSRRWRLTFPFGLIHGFGFAGALQEIALPRAQLPLALVSFNLGVEAGQLAVLLLILPLLLWVRRRQWFVDYGMRGLSTAISVAGLLWFVQRLA